MQADTVVDAPYGHYRPRGTVANIIRITRSQPASWTGRRVSFFLRRIAISKLNGAPVDIDSLGARMRLYPYNNVCEKRILFTPQFFDADERSLIAGAITDGFTFVDIGANIGGYSLFVAAAAGPGARILAIEPQPKVFEKLVGNIRLNEFATIKAVACAIADIDGELTLFVDSDNQGGSSVKIVRDEGGGNSIRVPSRTLLGLLQDERFTKVDAVKIDVEGAEDLVLEPFLRQAPESLWPRLMIIEHGAPRWHVDLPGLLAEKGYRLDATTRNNIVFRRG